MSKLYSTLFRVLLPARNLHHSVVKSCTIRNSDVDDCAVCTTGYTYINKTGERLARCAIYFGPDDPRNRIDDLGGDHTHVAAKIIALTKAVEGMKLSHGDRKEIPKRIKTDFRIVNGADYLDQLKFWANRKFIKQDGEEMTHSELLKKLYETVKDTEISIEFKEAVENGQRNYVNDLVLKGKRFRTHQQQQPDFVHGINNGFTIDGHGRTVQSGTTKGWSVVYVLGMYSQFRNGFEIAAGCTYWPFNEAGGGLAFRLAYVPVTLFRAQLAAIEEALKQADDAGLKDVLIITDSAHFLKYYKTNWENSLKEDLPNVFIYNRIRDLARNSNLNVRFRYEKINLEKHEWEIIKDRCEDGFALPIIGKDRSEYDLEIAEMAQAGCSKALAGTGTKRVRLFVKKTAESTVPRGLYWDTVDDQFSITHESELLPTGTPGSMILTAMRKASDLGCELLVMRTNSETIIKSYGAWLPIWQRTGWRNSLHKPIKDIPTWREIYELKKNIKVHWEYCEEFTDEDLNVVSAFQQCLNRNKKFIS